MLKPILQILELLLRYSSNRQILANFVTFGNNANSPKTIAQLKPNPAKAKVNNIGIFAEPVTASFLINFLKLVQYKKMKQ